MSEYSRIKNDENEENYEKNEANTKTTIKNLQKMFQPIKLNDVPVYAFVVLSIGLCATYSISVSLGHVYYWFPYISDTGAEPPESGIFGFTLNIVTVLLIISMYIRYCQIICIKEAADVNFHLAWNKIALVSGFLSAFGMNMVANFSEINMGIQHVIGAFICFATAIIYFLIQTKMSYHFVNHASEFAITKYLFIFRAVLCLLMLTAYFLTVWFGKIAANKFTGKKLNYWTEKDGGFQERLIATFSEWITSLCIGVYIMTFTQELRKVECDGFTVRRKIK